MTSPDLMGLDQLPAGSVSTSNVNSLQTVTQATISQAANAELVQSINDLVSGFFSNILGGFSNIPNLIASAINQFISDLVYALKNATGGFVDLTGLLSGLNQTATTAAATATNAQSTATSASSAAATATTIANSKPSITDIALTANSLWTSINVNEDTTFPRTLLSYGSASSVASGGGGTSAHSHGLSTPPQYQPPGNGSSTLEIAYVRSAKSRAYTQIGFITGTALTALGLSGWFVGLYSVNTTTGNLTLVNTVSASTDWSGTVTATSTEYRVSMGQTISANQNDVWAIVTLQYTNALQTCASLMCTTMNNINPPTTQFPRKNFCRDHASSFSSLPSSIVESNLDYGALTIVPFYALRE